MREMIEINGFHKGVVSNPDYSDIPNDACIYSTNVDPDSPEGVLTPLKDKLTVSTHYGDTAKKSAWIQQDATKWDLIYTNGTQLYDAVDFYGSTLQNLQGALAVKSFAVNNREVHIGVGNATPKWLGYVGWGQFDGAAPTGLQYEGAECSNSDSGTSGNIVISSLTYVVGTAPQNYVTTKRYRYAKSFVYDGYQESPVIYHDDNPVSDSADCIVTLKAWGAVSNPEMFNPRITAVKLYRSEALLPATQYDSVRLLTTIDINKIINKFLFFISISIKRSF